MKTALLFVTALFFTAPGSLLAQTEETVVKGVVLSVKSHSRILTLRSSADRTRHDIFVPNDATITMDGKSARLRDFTRGSLATIQYIRRPDGVKEAVVARVPDSRDVIDLEPVGQVASAASTASALPKTAGNRYLSLFLGVGLLTIGCLVWFVRREITPQRG